MTDLTSMVPNRNIDPLLVGMMAVSSATYLDVACSFMSNAEKYSKEKKEKGGSR